MLRKIKYIYPYIDYLHVLAVHSICIFCETWCHHELLLLCVASCRKRIIMKEKHLIPFDQESIYCAMKPYFAKHCLLSCGEQCEAIVSHHRRGPWQSKSRGFAKFFVHCTVT